MLNLSIQCCDAILLLLLCPQVITSTSSACNSTLTRHSHVLSACGHAPDHIRASIRLSLGRFTTEAEITELISQLTHAIHTLRQISKVPQ